MSDATLSVSREDGIALVLLNRPEVMNAINDRMRKDLLETLDDLETDTGIRVMVISASGDAFSAGADLREFKSLYEEYQRTGLKSAFGGPELAIRFARFRKPIIAAVNGLAVGWGMTMPLACDIRIASSRAKFSAAFVRVGLTPEFGSCFLLPELVGYGRAAEAMLTGRTINAEEALHMGFVSRVTPHDLLMTEAFSLARRIALNPPHAVCKTKALLRRRMDEALEEWIAYEALVFQECMNSSEHYEAVLNLLSEMASKKQTTPSR
jgi:2-(1,2-epoxy-1,2-dihydrophenyl)acetyl-CoA isomerase